MRAMRRAVGVTSQLSPTAGLVAPVTVAQIELGEPARVEYISIADANCDEVRQALVLVRLHNRPLATVVVDAIGGLVDIESCAAKAWASLPMLPPGIPLPTSSPDEPVPPGTRAA